VSADRGDELRGWCQNQLGLDWNDAWRAPLLHHLKLLQKWAPRVNLVSLAAGEDLLVRHVVDSLSLLQLEVVREAEGAAADIGSGAGFPGVPLAVTCPKAQWTLIEPRKKRGAFITQVIAAAAIPNAEWLSTRTPDSELNGRFDLVVSRATLEPETLLGHARPLLKVGGVVAIMAAHAPKTAPAGWARTESKAFTLAGKARWLASYSPD
jgi:16S rRNA (guanine527-N7)-methyltransferase